MKHTVIAFVLLILLAAITALNSVYVCSASHRLESAAEASAVEARSEWEKCRPLLSLTVHNKLFEEAENALIKMEVYSEDASSPEYIEAYRHFVFCCKEFREDETASIQSLM